MEQLCDNTSVGVIVQNTSGETLLLHRARYPFGMAAPAGHIDNHGSPELAAVNEVFEETGLTIPLSALKKIISERKVQNRCRRKNGDYHGWTVFIAQGIDGQLLPSASETKGCEWVSAEELQVLANTTHKHTSEVALGARVLEHVWLDFLTEASIIQ